MDRKCRYKRTEQYIVTPDWIETYCKPRLTERDFRILRFIYDYRIVTSEQIAKVFFGGSKSTAVRRLRVLFDLYLIERFFPEVPSGSALQHVVLDQLGARVIGIEKFVKVKKLPLSYRHQVLVNEFRIETALLGFSVPEASRKIKQVSADLYYPEEKIAVEIDMGTESFKVLRRKALRYNNSLSGLRWIIFITAGSQQRIKEFFDSIGPAVANNRIGCRLDKLGKLINTVKQGI